MCGIGGVLRIDGKRVLKRWLEGIDARIAHRGPDGAGQFRDRVKVETEHGARSVEVGLVHRRLAVIDLDGGDQPMVSSKGPGGAGLVAVVFNGCIYNHRELRTQLEAEGHKFVSDHSDTEVLLHGHRQWGVGLAERLEGMYAYALWDQTSGAITLARDPFGKKPLYFAAAEAKGRPRLVAFASDPIAVGRIAAEFESEMSENGRLAGYLQNGYLSGAALDLPQLGSVLELEPGGVRTFHPGGRRAGTLRIDEAEGPVESIETLLEQAVQRRLEADVPLGCFLSGGIDSSLVAHFARIHLPDLRTFSVRMPDPRYDESRHAERVAAHLGTDHTTLEVAFDPAEDLVRLISQMGQPFGDSSLLPTYWVSRAAREHVTVALSGDGGDELFVGYERYMAARHLASRWRVLRMLPSRRLRKCHPKSLRHKVGRLADAARDFPRMGLASLESMFTCRQLDALLGGASHDFRSIDPGDDALQALRRDDLVNYLPFDLMRKVDAASMSVALEVRCPFLDRQLARAALAVPTDELIPGGRRKGMLRDIAKRHLPVEVVNRPKMGFAIPIGKWFRTDFGSMRTLLLDQLRSTDPFARLPIERSAVKRLIDEHLAYEVDHGQRLFALLTLSLWAKRAGE